MISTTQITVGMSCIRGSLPGRPVLLCRSSSSFTPRFPITLKSPSKYANFKSFEVVAFKESSKVQDWRVKEMVEVAHKYFIDFLNKGHEEITSDIFTDDCVHVDAVWDAAHPTVGVQGMKHYIHDLKTAFPDWYVEIGEIATCDTNSIWVSYEGSATGLGEYHGHKASHHTSNFSGINVLKFNEDRSKIKEVQVYRSAFAEDRAELGEKVPEGGFRDLRLRRLV